MLNSSQKQCQGFTLVELLIVVALIGVLSTVGIPTYKRHVAKAKTTQAKLQLSHFFTLNETFQAEYGAYGSNLVFLGLAPKNWELESGIKKYYYTIGFPSAVGCDIPLADVGGAGFIPQTAALKADITARNPNYYDATTGTEIFYRYGLGGNPYCLPASYSPTGSTYTITASGVISGKNISSSNPAEVDQWSLDQDKNLIHENVGY